VRSWTGWTGLDRAPGRVCPIARRRDASWARACSGSCRKVRKTEMAFEAARAGQPPPVRPPVSRTRQTPISTIGLRPPGGIPKSLESIGLAATRSRGQKSPRGLSPQTGRDDRAGRYNSFVCNRKGHHPRARLCHAGKFSAFLKRIGLDSPWKFRKIKYSKESVEYRQNSRSEWNADGAGRLPAGGDLTGREAKVVAGQVCRQRSTRC